MLLRPITKLIEPIKAYTLSLLDSKGPCRCDERMHSPSFCMKEVGLGRWGEPYGQHRTLTSICRHVRYCRILVLISSQVSHQVSSISELMSVVMSDSEELCVVLLSSLCLKWSEEPPIDKSDLRAVVNTSQKGRSQQQVLAIYIYIFKYMYKYIYIYILFTYIYIY